MKLAKALDDLEHLANGMADTVSRKATIAPTEIAELQRRIAAVREASETTEEDEPAKKSKVTAAKKTGAFDTEHAPE